MNCINSSIRKYLRSLAHHLNPVVMIGKEGLTENLIQKVDDALNCHELIKIKFVTLKEKDAKNRICSEIEKRTSSERIGQIGHVAIFFRQHPEEEKRKIRLP